MLVRWGTDKEARNNLTVCFSVGVEMYLFELNSKDVLLAKWKAF